MELLRKLRALGLQTTDPMNLPPVAFHDHSRSHVGETMHRAVELGGNHFKAKPKIIFVAIDLGEYNLRFSHIPSTKTLPAPLHWEIGWWVGSGGGGEVCESPVRDAK